MSRKKFIVRNRKDDKVICGIRYDEKEEEFLVGWPKKQEEEFWQLIKLLDLNPEELEKEVKEDSYRMKLKTVVNKEEWISFAARIAKLYKLEFVKSFRRLMN